MWLRTCDLLALAPPLLSRIEWGRKCRGTVYVLCARVRALACVRVREREYGCARVRGCGLVGVQAHGRARLQAQCHDPMVLMMFSTVWFFSFSRASAV